MKKASTRKKPSADPRAASLREMPEIDFSAFAIRRNPFAARIAREGIEVLHDSPSPRSVAAIPEIDLDRARVRRSPYASRAAEAVAKLQHGKGRPRRGGEVGPTPTRSIRLPEAVWDALEQAAVRRGTTVHALLREAVVRYLALRLE
jgi:hypothetical protein